jgi:hypothetical protein
VTRQKERGGLLSFAKPKNQNNSFIVSKTNPNVHSLFNENSINFDNSNSISLMKKNTNDKKGYALNRLFASNQVGNGVSNQISKSPNKVFTFRNKKVNGK